MSTGEYILAFLIALSGFLALWILLDRIHDYVEMRIHSRTQNRSTETPIQQSTFKEKDTK